MSMISVQDIHKTYGKLEVLKGVDLEVNEGEMLGIVGASGAGKSTLLYIIGAIEEADSGIVEIGGKSLMQMKEKALANFRNKEIGFVFQFHHLLPEFTALENISIPAWIGKTPEATVKKRAGELAELLGITDRLTHKPKQLSGGEQQRVAIARALINDPRVLLADEPTGNLDSDNSNQLMELLTNLKQELGQTTIMVTHDLELVKNADRVVSMEDGIIEN